MTPSSRQIQITGDFSLTNCCFSCLLVISLFMLLRGNRAIDLFDWVDRWVIFTQAPLITAQTWGFSLNRLVSTLHFVQFLHEILVLRPQRPRPWPRLGHWRALHCLLLSFLHRRPPAEQLTAVVYGRGAGWAAALLVTSGSGARFELGDQRSAQPSPATTISAAAKDRSGCIKTKRRSRRGRAALMWWAFEIHGMRRPCASN